MSDQKKDHPILNGVAIGSIMLVVTTIYNLVLAHIWPVAIHFGEYSLANVIFILVSVLTSVLVAFLSFYFALFVLMRWVAKSVIWAISTPEQRKTQKSPWYDRVMNGMLSFFLFPFLLINWWDRLRNPLTKNEAVQSHPEQMPQQQVMRKRKENDHG